MPRRLVSLEPLESRIAPAGITSVFIYFDPGAGITFTHLPPTPVLSSGHVSPNFDFPAVTLVPHFVASATLNFMDVGGDEATITASKGTAADLMAGATFSPTDGHLVSLKLSQKFKGAEISITSDGEGMGADGAVVNVDLIDATGVDLASVNVMGDLGQIKAGDGVPSTPALGSLTALSLSKTAALESHVLGRITNLTITNQVGGGFYVEGPNGSIGTAHVGSLAGGATFGVGSIITTRAIGSITVDHDLQGGAGERSGAILAGGSITTVSVGGNLVGATASLPAVSRPRGCWAR